ncbi:MAG: N-6 DNA methylase [Cyanobacteria bacterium J06634_5]
MNSQTILNQMKACFQGVLSEDVAVDLCLQILLWMKKTDTLPESLTAVSAANSGSDDHNSWLLINQLTEAMQHLSEDKRLGDSNVLFFSDPALYRSLPVDRLEKAIEIARSALKTNVLNHFTIPASLYHTVASDLLPEEITQLATGLAEISAGTDVGCLFDYSGTFAHHAASAGGNAHLETPHLSNIYWLTRELSDLTFSIGLVNPLAHDALTSTQQQRKFDKTIAFLPIGKIRDKKTIDSKWLHLLPRGTNSRSVLAAVYSLSQTRKTAVLIVPSSLLSARGGEQQLRYTWLANHQVQIVIELPSGLLSRSNKQISIVVLNAKRSSEDVRFIDGTTKEFVRKDKRKQAELFGWEKLLAIALSNNDDPHATNVPVQDVIDQDSQLTVDLHVLSPTLKKAYTRLYESYSTHEQFTLAECVDFVRQSTPLTKVDELEAETVKEVTISDFPKFAYLYAPSKTIQVNPQLIDSGTMTKCCLHPHDIVISIRGTTGKVAIASPNIPSPGRTGWLVNKSCLILRANQTVIDPIYLFMYLNSEVGQALLGQIVSGSTTPLIQLQSLKNLPIALPPLESPSSLKAKHIFEQQVQLQEEIDFLKQKQSRISKGYWSLDSPT